MNETINIREGKQEDLPAVMELIRELAHYEKAPGEVENTVEKMEEEGFGEHPVFGLFVAESNRNIIGLALYYYSYSTWKGKSLFLEDLIVTADYRRKGIGKLLFDKVVEKAKNENAGRLTWQVLDWNKPAINFYQQIGASLDSTWWTGKLTREQIQKYFR